MFKKLFFISMLLIFLVGDVCFGGPENWPTNGWKTSTPEEQGMDSAKLAEMLISINLQKDKIDSIAVIRHGCLVLESYRYPNTAETKHVVNSCTKSVISALIGIAVKEGYIKGIDQKVNDFFPESQYKFGTGMNTLALKYLLTMSSGMDWLEVPTSISPEEMLRSKNWTRYILESTVIANPGTRFNYNSGGSHLLSSILTRATGKSALDYGREKLFGPLGITDVDWEHDPQGVNNGGWGLKMRTVDMAKFGYLYLKRGVWDGKEIIPADWVGDSTRKHIETPSTIGYNGYGYLWWLTEYGGYYAMGSNGQYIFVIPEKDLVVAFTSSLAINAQLPEALMREFVLPAIKSDNPLNSNPKAVDEVNAAVKIMANP